MTQAQKADRVLQRSVKILRGHPINTAISHMVGCFTAHLLVHIYQAKPICEADARRDSRRAETEKRFLAAGYASVRTISS